MIRYVTIKKFAAESGYTEDAIRSKIKNGVWLRVHDLGICNMPNDARVRFIRLPEVLRVTGLSRSQIYKLEGAGQFPGRVKLGAITVAWVEAEVLEWCAKRIAERDGRH